MLEFLDPHLFNLDLSHKISTILKIQETHTSMDWFKGKFTGKPHI